jgi:hypothetical protein
MALLRERNMWILNPDIEDRFARIRRTIIDLNTHLKTPIDVSDASSALNRVCAQGSMSALASLLSKRTYSDDELHVSLLVASAFGHYEISQRILSTEILDQPLPLFVKKMMVIQAALYGQTETLRRMLDDCDDREALIGPSTDPLQSTLCLAAWKGHLSTVDLLIHYEQVDVSESENMVLLHAAMGGHVPVVMLLVQLPGVDALTAKWPHSIGAIVHDAIYTLSSSRRAARLALEDLATCDSWRRLPVDLRTEIVLMSYGHLYASRSRLTTRKHVEQLIRLFDRLSFVH